MSTSDKIMTKIGKSGLKIDEEIPKTYIFRLGAKYVLMRIRGFIRSIFYKNISGTIFIGKKVRMYCKSKITIGRNSKIHDYSKIDALSTDGVRIGRNVVLGRGTTIECTGTIRNIGKGISIGNNTSFSNDCFFGCAGGVYIGDDVVGGQYIRFHSENHNYGDLDKLIKDQGITRKGIFIDDNCWIGSGAVFLDGVTLGKGCVVAANAVVTKSFPENSVIGGVPAKILKNRGGK